VNLLTAGVWKRITALSRRSQRAFVAVPYFGSGASKLLHLKDGSILVVKFDLDSVKAGQVNPDEIIRLIRRGVKVYTCANLHAKVFVFGDTAIVGSTNVSSSSANNLIEACVEVKDRNFARKCVRFVKSLLGDRVTLEFAKKLKKYYRKPRNEHTRSRKRSVPKQVMPEHSRIWLVPLEIVKWEEVDYRNEKQGMPIAERALTNYEKIQTFLWWGDEFIEFIDRMRIGERVIMITEISSRKTLVSPPGRILSFRRYNYKGEKRAIVYLGVPKDKRSRDLKSFRKSLGRFRKDFDNLNRGVKPKPISKSELIYRIDQVFS